MLTSLPLCVLCLCLSLQSALDVYREMLLLYVDQGRQQVNGLCADLEPWQVIALTVLTTMGGVWAKGFLFQRESKQAHASTK